MKILVADKRVVDASTRIRVKGDGFGVALDNVKMAMNPFDEIALEQAIRLKEAGVASEIIVASIGGAKVEETLRHGLAMGADRAIHVLHDERIEPLIVAKLLRVLVTAENADLVLLGKQAIDDDANQTGQMLAALLGCGQATFASAIDVKETRLRVSREVDGGLRIVELDLPAVVTVDLRLNTPRFVALPAIMKARSKPIARMQAEETGVDLTPRTEVLRTEEAPQRKGGVIVGSVAELVEKLRNEAGVIP